MAGKIALILMVVCTSAVSAQGEREISDRAMQWMENARKVREEVIPGEIKRKQEYIAKIQKGEIKSAGAATMLKEARTEITALRNELKQIRSKGPFIPKLDPESMEVGQAGVFAEKRGLFEIKSVISPSEVVVQHVMQATAVKRSGSTYPVKTGTTPFVLTGTNAGELVEGKPIKLEGWFKVVAVKDVGGKRFFVVEHVNEPMRDSPSKKSTGKKHENRNKATDDVNGKSDKR